MNHNIQTFDGKEFNAQGGYQETVGFNAGPAWGTLSQSTDFNGVKSPVTVSGGANLINDSGTGVSGSFAHQPHIGGQASITGQLGLVKTPDHNVTAWATHNRTLNANFKPIGPEVNSAGINYSHSNGASAFVNGTTIHGGPTFGTAGGSIPLMSGNSSNLSLGAQSTFGRGMKPEHQAVLRFSKKF